MIDDPAHLCSSKLYSVFKGLPLLAFLASNFVSLTNCQLPVKNFLINFSWQLGEKPLISSNQQLIAATTLSNIPRLQANVNDKKQTFLIYLRNMNIN
ncbi:hypothetical protein ACLUWI_07735, partial [Limosilactobacillus mucosae]|uniref:hypothetical protein n=1 Tax=Limosilactobacillus mucosae TaxID=97478 RepID=UPI003994E824